MLFCAATLFFWSQIFLFLLLSASFFLFYTEFLCCKSSGILCSIVSGPPFHYDYLCFRAFLPSRSPMFRKTISTSLIFYNCYIVKSRGRAGRYLGRNDFHFGTYELARGQNDRVPFIDIAIYGRFTS